MTTNRSRPLDLGDLAPDISSRRRSECWRPARCSAPLGRPRTPCRRPLGGLGLHHRWHCCAAGQRRSIRFEQAGFQLFLQQLQSRCGSDGFIAGRRAEGGRVRGGEQPQGRPARRRAFLRRRVQRQRHVGAGPARTSGRRRTSTATTSRSPPRRLCTRSTRHLRAPVAAIPTGTCPTVGVAGLTLGGGIGADTRHAGLTCDALQSATVVLPSGDVVTASANDHPDLFWALRGGGGGNFGVTTSMTFATFATGDSDVVRLDFPPSSAVQVLVGWQSWLNGADRNAWAMVDLTVGTAQPDCHILATCPAGGAAGWPTRSSPRLACSPARLRTRR